MRITFRPLEESDFEQFAQWLAQPHVQRVLHRAGRVPGREVERLEVEAGQPVSFDRVLLVNNGSLVADGTPQDVLKDFAFLRQNRLIPTSLLKSNLEYLPRTGRFLRAEALAHYPAPATHLAVRATAAQ